MAVRSLHISTIVCRFFGGLVLFRKLRPSLCHDSNADQSSYRRHRECLHDQFDSNLLVGTGVRHAATGAKRSGISIDQWHVAIVLNHSHLLVVFDIHRSSFSQRICKSF